MALLDKKSIIFQMLCVKETGFSGKGSGFIGFRVGGHGESETSAIFQETVGPVILIHILHADAPGLFVIAIKTDELNFGEFIVGGPDGVNILFRGQFMAQVIIFIPF